MSYFSSKVEDMQEPETWRELLRGIISDGHEKQRIADELEVAVGVVEVEPGLFGARHAASLSTLSQTTAWATLRPSSRT